MHEPTYLVKMGTNSRLPFFKTLLLKQPKTEPSKLVRAKNFRVLLPFNALEARAGSSKTRTLTRLEASALRDAACVLSGPRRQAGILRGRRATSDRE